MRILVTGAAGFLGSHVTEALLARGEEVVGFDVFDDFYDPALKRRNLADALDSVGFRLEEGDVRDLDRVRAALSQCDAVIHLAARAGVRPSIARPGLYVSHNVQGTTPVLEACRLEGISRIVIASSSSVYGGLKSLPFHEELQLEHPYSPYGSTKLACEFLAGTWAHLYGIRVNSLRYFTIFGPRQRPEMAIHKFVRRLTRGDPIPVFGDGSSRRDYTFVSDAMAGTLAALDRTGTMDPGHRVYNIGGNQTTDLHALIGKIAGRLGVEPNFDRQPDQPGDVPATWADITRARKELGWEPKTPLDDGLDAFIKWYREEARS